MVGIQYVGRYLQYRQGDNISTVEGIQYSGRYLQYGGVTFSTVGDNISTVEVMYQSIPSLTIPPGDPRGMVRLFHCFEGQVLAQLSLPRRSGF